LIGRKKKNIFGDKRSDRGLLAKKKGKKRGEKKKMRLGIPKNYE